MPSVTARIQETTKVLRFLSLLFNCRVSENTAFELTAKKFPTWEGRLGIMKKATCMPEANAMGAAFGLKFDSYIDRIYFWAKDSKKDRKEKKVLPSLIRASEAEYRMMLAGGDLKDIRMSNFFRVLGILLENGCDEPEAVQMSAASAEFEAGILLSMLSEIMRKHGIYSAFQVNYAFFSPIDLQLVKAGTEVLGALPHACDAIAQMRMAQIISGQTHADIRPTPDPEHVAFLAEMVSLTLLMKARHGKMWWTDFRNAVEKSILCSSEMKYLSEMFEDLKSFGHALLGTQDKYGDSYPLEIMLSGENNECMMENLELLVQYLYKETLDVDAPPIPLVLRPNVVMRQTQAVPA